MEKQKIILSLSQIANLIGGTLNGDDIAISGLTTPEEQKEGYICMITVPEKAILANEETSDNNGGGKVATCKAAACKASAFIITENVVINTNKPTITIKDARAALVKLMIAFHPQEPITHNISKHSVIAESATIGNPCDIGHFVCIGNAVIIGDNTKISNNTVIGDNVKIGKNCIIYPNVTIYENCTIGDNVIIHAGATIGADGFGFIPGENPIKIPQKGTVKIEDFVEVGANTCIDRATIGATIIGFGSKIDNLCMIGHNTTIGKSCLIASQVGFSGSIEMGDRVVVAGQVGFADHIKIASDTIFGGQAGVPNDVKERGAYLGAPCIPMLKFAKAAAIFSELPDLKRRVTSLEKQKS